MYLRPCDLTARKNEIRDALLYIAHSNGQNLSRAKADKLATKFKAGRFDPDLAPFIDYADPTGETATRNALAA